MNAATLALIAVGGALGSVLRYVIDVAVTRFAGTTLPWGTLLINVAGSLAVGVLIALVGPVRLPSPTPVQAFVGIGVLAGFTTFSAFSAQTLLLAQAGRVAEVDHRPPA